MPYIYRGAHDTDQLDEIDIPQDIFTEMRLVAKQHMRDGTLEGIFTWRDLTTPPAIEYEVRYWKFSQKRYREAMKRYPTSKVRALEAELACTFMRETSGRHQIIYFDWVFGGDGKRADFFYLIARPKWV